MQKRRSGTFFEPYASATKCAEQVVAKEENEVKWKQEPAGVVWFTLAGSFVIANHRGIFLLYRVSTKGQVEKDDIPMQKEAYRNFAESQGWEIVKEFSEKGVSGFKKLYQ